MNAPTAPPTSAPSTSVPPPVTLTAFTAGRLAEVLGLVEEFLRCADPQTHAELYSYLRHHPQRPADPAWLLDSLGFHSAHLTRLLDQPTDQPGDELIVREVWL